MQPFLRFVGVLNAAVWFGSVVFFTLMAGPAFFSAEVATFLPRSYAGRVAEVIIGRLVMLQIGCAVIGLLQLGVERLYFGRRSDRWITAVLTVLLGMNLLAAGWLLPRMHELQQIRYSRTASETQKASAAGSFGLWHGLSQAANLAAMAALGTVLWRLTRPVPVARFATTDKFRS